MGHSVGRLTLTAPGVEAVLDPGVGGRIAALRVGDLDLLVTEGFGPIAWGAYPMCPWAGRLRQGRLRFGGDTYQFPLSMPPHAIHGTTWDRPWQVVEARPAAATMSIALESPWPFGGRVMHRVALEASRLRATLEVQAGDRPMPAIVGWHPWFARRLARGGPIELDLAAGGMLLRGPDGVPTGEVVPPPPGPWDDAFVDLARPPVLRWPGAIEVTVHSDAQYWVVFTEREEGICVEPQTGPPNGLEDGPYAVVGPGRPLVATMTLAWN
jgi:aldose 1-epimerase